MLLKIHCCKDQALLKAWFWWERGTLSLICFSKYFCQLEHKSRMCTILIRSLTSREYIAWVNCLCNICISNRNKHLLLFCFPHKFLISRGCITWYKALIFSSEEIVTDYWTCSDMLFSWYETNESSNKKKKKRERALSPIHKEISVK